MAIQDILDEVDNIQAGIDAGKVEIFDLLADGAKLAPFAVGDTIVVNGYGHTGKSMIINRMYLRLKPTQYTQEPYFNEPSWVAYGNVLKADGAEGKKEGIHVCPVKGEGN